MAVQKIGFITGISGEYKNAVLKLEDNEKVSIGRDMRLSDIVISANNNRVSRIHCSIVYDVNNNVYRLYDLSTNGTFNANTGERYPYAQEVLLERGTAIMIGDKQNILLLN